MKKIVASVPPLVIGNVFPLEGSGFAEIDYVGIPATTFYWIGGMILVVALISFLLHRRKK